MSAVAQLPTGKAPTLLEKFASKFAIDQDKLLTTLKATAFKQRGDTQVTNEQMTALLIVADQYGLNPFTKEIFAYPDKQNGIVPVVSVDGWARIINEHGALDGIEFRYSDEMITLSGAKPCPAWCEVIITRKDRAKPIIVREYLDEVFRVLDYATPWKTHTKRMLRHKTLIQGARIAFGFAGIYDEDEAERILDAHAVDGTVTDRKVEIEQPRARIESSVTPASASPTATAGSADPAAATSAGGGGQPDQKDAQPMKPSQVNILRTKMKNAGLTDVDLEAKFGKSLEPKAGKGQLGFGDFNDVQDWIAGNAKT